MIKINYEKCTGCGACVQKCPPNCISWETGEFDFRYPIINEDICINCGLCERTCPIEKENPEIIEQRAFAAVHRDDSILNESTSGGAFTSLAEYVLKKDGVVYGATMDSHKKVQHIRVKKEDGIDSLRGSKYLQSDTGNTFKDVENDLKNSIFVLYTGTPCQIDGLRSFLGREYDNLFLVDIVCHGVGSQRYFDKYLEYAQMRYGKIEQLKFRSKDYSGWSCSGCVVSTKKSNKKVKKPYYDYENYYYAYFLSGEIYRKSCYSCKYANLKRVGDITLGDYWGVEALGLSMDTRRGCSLVLVNTKKGIEVLQQLYDLAVIETTVEQATHCNRQLIAPSHISNDREKRIQEYNCLSAFDIQKVYEKEHKMRILKGKIKTMIPYKLKLYMRSKRK